MASKNGLIVITILTMNLFYLWRVKNLKDNFTIRTVYFNIY